MIQISASLLAADYARLGEDTSRADIAGIDSFHFDMMDGRYVPNLALTPQHLKALRSYTHLPFHVHFELEYPDVLLKQFNPLGADLVIVQWNTLTNPTRTFELIRAQGAKVGLSVNPDDHLKAPSEFIPELDMFLILGVQPGFGGQRMASGTCSRVREIRALANMVGSKIEIAVDGGVNTNNITKLVEAGADCLIMGTAIFQAEDLARFVTDIRKQIQVFAE